MRDIEFRAYNKKHKEWIYGTGIVKVEQDTYPTGEYEMVDSVNYDELDYWQPTYYTQDIDINTLGQYTGLKDENDIKIFEGDIIDFSYDIFNGNFDTLCAKGIIVFEEGAFWVKPYEIENKKVNSEDEEWYLLYRINLDVIEVIGNIYENKELLGENMEEDNYNHIPRID